MPLSIIIDLPLWRSGELNRQGPVYFSTGLSNIWPVDRVEAWS